jgi:flavin-dependent dehydrogenase
MKMRQVAIIGGGPSGAMCGERLARAGFDVTIYDEHLAWEKPCGGGLTHKAIVAYPYLLDGPEPKKLIRQVELISGEKRRARFELDHPIVIYSREVLNGLLLRRAGSAGCRTVRARATDLDSSAARVRLTAAGVTQESDFAVLAAGARNALLPGAQPLDSADLEMTLGYFIPARRDVMQVKFLGGLEGYLWSFPRADHLSVGICGRMASHTSNELRRHLEQFLADESLATAGAHFYSHVLPSPQPQTLRRRRVVGRNWALIGDAAGLVDPVTGEGLYYAMRSGDLLAEALIAGRPAQYPSRLRADFLADIEIAAGIAPAFYGGRFLGGSNTTRMIQFVDRSPTFRAIVSDVFSGAQDYRTLRWRLWTRLGINLVELLASLLRSEAGFAHGKPVSH